MKHTIYKIKDNLRRISPVQRAEYLRENRIVAMGRGCEIYPNVDFGSEPYLIKLGNNVRLTGGVKFITHDGGMWVIRNLKWSPNADRIDKIIVGDNVMIGINSVIMPGVKIGSNVVVGLGSIVTRDIPDNSVAVGSPAKVVSTIEEYYNKNVNRIDETKHMSQLEKKEYYLRKFNFSTDC